MDPVEYNDIVFLEKLNEIKATIHNSGFRIDYRKAYDVDVKMRKIIDQIYDENCEDSSLVDLFHKLDMSINRRTAYTLTYYYFALYNDNLKLLSRLLEEDVELFDAEEHFHFELLDKEFTEYFTEDQFVFLVRYCKEELISFYRKIFTRNHSQMNMAHRRELVKQLNQISERLFSTEEEPSLREKNALKSQLEELAEELKTSYVYKYPLEERKKYCELFSRIMTKAPFICKKENNPEGEVVYSRLLSPEVLSLYGEEQILQMGDYEKKLASDNESTPGVLDRVKEIFEEYPDYHTNIDLDPEVLRLFTNEELYHMTPEEVTLYEKASKEGILTRFKPLLKQNEAIGKHPAFIHRFSFDQFTDEEISSFSERAINRIGKLIVHTKFFDPDAEYYLKKSTHRVAKVDQIIQKVKKYLH